MNLNDDKFCDWEDVDQASAEEMEDADAGQDGMFEHYRFDVSDGQTPVRVDKYLASHMEYTSRHRIQLAIKKEYIRVNDRVAKANCIVRPGDVIKFVMPYQRRGLEILPEDIPLDIVYEDENILLVDKPVGMVVHEDESGDSDTLINRIKSYLYHKGEYHPESEMSFAPALCNRIDRNTCGIVIAAKNAEALRILNHKIRDRELTKLYLCIACGKVTPDSATLTAYLEKNSDTNTVKISDRKTKNNLTIKTKYKVLAYNGENSLLKVDLLTGRTHQIRAHLAYIGHPLLGDGKYGSNKLNRQYGFKYQALCSYELEFKFTTDAGCISYLDGRKFRAKAPDFVKMFGDKVRL